MQVRIGIGLAVQWCHSPLETKRGRRLHFIKKHDLPEASGRGEGGGLGKGRESNADEFLRTAKSLPRVGKAKSL